MEDPGKVHSDPGSQTCPRSSRPAKGVYGSRSRRTDGYRATASNRARVSHDEVSTGQVLEDFAHRERRPQDPLHDGHTYSQNESACCQKNTQAPEYSEAVDRSTTGGSLRHLDVLFDTAISPLRGYASRRLTITRRQGAGVAVRWWLRACIRRWPRTATIPFVPATRTASDRWWRPRTPHPGRRSVTAAGPVRSAASATLSSAKWISMILVTWSPAEDRPTRPRTPPQSQAEMLFRASAAGLLPPAGAGAIAADVLRSVTANCSPQSGRSSPSSDCP